MITLRHVHKTFGSRRNVVEALRDVDVEVGRGEFVCLIGTSGCGKSTILNLVAGLDTPTSGTVEVAGRPALMFQESALFPWLTVAANVELPLRLAGVPKAERRARVEQLVSAVHLDGFGGQAAAPAVRRHAPAGRPGAGVRPGRRHPLDGRAVRRARCDDRATPCTTELEELVRARSLTVLFVTHNVREAARLADRIVVMSPRPGRVTASYDVAIERPRRIESQDVGALAARITDELREEALAHARR